jgi:putative ABC transport system permease protein
MAESAVIAVVGGLAGVLIAAAVLSAASGRFGVPLALEWPTAAGSLVAAAVAGVAAGWHPARRAASLDVIAALRHE